MKGEYNIKKGMRLVLVTALFAAIMSGCGKKEKAVTDDFKDVQRTTATASETDVDTEAYEVNYMYFPEGESGAKG